MFRAWPGGLRLRPRVFYEHCGQKVQPLSLEHGTGTGHPCLSFLDTVTESTCCLASQWELFGSQFGGWPPTNEGCAGQAFSQSCRALVQAHPVPGALGLVSLFHIHRPSVSSCLCFWFPLSLAFLFSTYECLVSILL